MKGSKEHKRLIAMMRSKYGKRSGVVKGCYYDDLLIFKMERCKKKYKRTKEASQ